MPRTAGMLANLNPIGRHIAGLHQPMGAFLETVVEPAAIQRAITLTLLFALPSHMPVEPVTDAHLRGDAASRRGRRGCARERISRFPPGRRRRMRGQQCQAAVSL
jgi:hypothetical protein